MKALMILGVMVGLGAGCEKVSHRLGCGDLNPRFGCGVDSHGFENLYRGMATHRDVFELGLPPLLLHGDGLHDVPLHEGVGSGSNVPGDQLLVAVLPLDLSGMVLHRFG